MQKKDFEKNKVLTTVSSLFVIIVFVLFIFWYKNSGAYQYETVSIGKGDISEEVTATGKVEAPTKIALHFKNTEKLVALHVKVGDLVTGGQVVARQDTRQFDTELSAMQADINLQKARLEQALSGSSKEDITVAESSVSSADTVLSSEEKLLEKAKQNTMYTLKDSYTKSDDVVRNNVDQLFSNSQTNNPKLIFPTIDSHLQGQIESDRVVIENKLKKWNTAVVSITATSSLDELFILTKGNLEKIRSFLDNISLIVNDSKNRPADISETAWDTWRTNIATSRSTINTTLANVSLSEENIAIKESSLKQAEANLQTTKEQLALKKAPSRLTDINVYQAQIDQALAAMQRVQNQRNDFTLSSPTKGIVVETSGEIGEIVTSQAPVVSIISGNGLQVKLNIVEDNIINVKVGQKAVITFDALPSKEFFGTVIAIDPAETTINGGVYYQATVSFDEKEDFVRSGMTVNVSIRTNDSHDTFFVPISALIKKDNKQYVRILRKRKIIEKEVVIGLKNNHGMVEIKADDISKDDKVILGDL